MSLSSIPNLPFPIDTTRWEEFQGRYDQLRQRPLSEADLADWLGEWSDLNRLVSEVGSLAHIGTSLDTTDEASEKTFLNFVENIAPGYHHADQSLKERLLEILTQDDGLPEDMRVPVMKMRNQADLFREANVPLFTELSKLGNEFFSLLGPSGCGKGFSC